MSRSLTAFLCSTYADLSVEREHVLDAIRRLQLRHDSMEFFGARPERSIETCLAQVRLSDVLVVIVGHRYGSIVPELGISYSEAEYREGYQFGKPCLVYIRDENVPVLPKHVERNPENLRLLEAWKTVLAARHTVATFSTAGQLAVQVAADLGRIAQALEQAPPRNQVDLDRESIVEELRTLLQEVSEKGLSQRVVLSTWRRAVADLLAGEGRQPTVFLSYSHDDSQVVQSIANGLRQSGIAILLDKPDSKYDTSVTSRIEEGLDTADFVAFFLSKAAMGSRWVQQEMNVAISRQVSGNRSATLLPILLDDAEIPALLKDIAYIDLRDGEISEGVARLVSSIERYLSEKREQKIPITIYSPIPPLWRREDFRNKSAAEIEFFFAAELMPEAQERAYRDWERVEALDLPEKFRARAVELAERRARELGLGERWEEWRRRGEEASDGRRAPNAG